MMECETSIRDRRISKLSYRWRKNSASVQGHHHLRRSDNLRFHETIYIFPSWIINNRSKITLCTCEWVSASISFYLLARLLNDANHFSYMNVEISLRAHVIVSMSKHVSNHRGGFCIPQFYTNSAHLSCLGMTLIGYSRTQVQRSAMSINLFMLTRLHRNAGMEFVVYAKYDIVCISRDELDTRPWVSMWGVNEPLTLDFNRLQTFAADKKKLLSHLFAKTRRRWSVLFPRLCFFFKTLSG